MSKTDGDYHWYWAHSVDSEVYHVADSKEHAIECGWANFPDGGFCIMEMDRSVPTADVFAWDEVLELYEERNEDCWGDGGAKISPTGEQKTELESVLAAALDAWMTKHDLHGYAFALGNQRAGEIFPEVAAQPESKP